MKKSVFSLLLFIGAFTVDAQYSLNFDGSDDLVTGKLVEGQFNTIEFWVKTENPIDGISKVMLPFSFDDEWEWIALNNSTSYIDGETISIGSYGNSFPTSTSTILTKGWHHIAIVSNGSNYDKIYLDAVLGNMISTQSKVLTTAVVHLGYRVAPSEYGKVPFAGNLDEVRIWNTSRTLEEIKTYMNTELTGSESGLLLYYRMNNPNSSCDIEDCNIKESYGARSGVNGSNNLPQFSKDVPVIKTVVCKIETNCVITSSDEGEKDTQSIVYPNPSDGYIEILGFTGVIKSCQITSNLGKVIEVERPSSNIDISSLPSGVYTITILTEHESVTKAFIKK